MKPEEIQQLLKLIDEYSLMVDTVPIQIWFLSDAETYGRVNQYHAYFMGLQKADMEFRKLDEFLPGNVADKCKQSNREVFETRNIVNSEELISDAEGEQRLIAITKIPKFNQDGKEIKYIICFGIDITDRKRAEEQLVGERWRLGGVIRGTNAGTWEWNIQTGETIFNDRWAEIVGHTLAELAPVSIKTWEALVHPADLQKSGALLECHFLGELPYYDCECRMKHKDGHWVWAVSYTHLTLPTNREV